MMPAFSHHGAVQRAGGRQRRWMRLLLGTMVCTLVCCAWSLGGGMVVLMALFAVSLGVGGIVKIPAGAVMELHRAVPIAPPRHPEIATTLAGLAARAGLAAPPALYRLPGDGINALAAGPPGRSAVGLSDETLSALSARELRAILAHEISHVAAGDTRLLALTCLVSKLTQGTAQFALVAALILMASTDTFLLTPWQIAVFTVAAPVVSLLQLALSRNQEFAADLGAVRLTDDPIGLVAALERIEALDDHPRRLRRGWLMTEGFGGLLRSHPSPRRRIARLLDRLYGKASGQPPLARPVVAARVPTATPLRPDGWLARTPGWRRACAGPAD